MTDPKALEAAREFHGLTDEMDWLYADRRRPEVIATAHLLEAYAAKAVADAVAECEKRWSGHYADLLISVTAGNEKDNRAALLIEFLEQCHRDGLNCAAAANAIRARGTK